MVNRQVCEDSEAFLERIRQRFAVDIDVESRWISHLGSRLRYGDWRADHCMELIVMACEYAVDMFSRIEEERLQMWGMDAS